MGHSLKNILAVMVVLTFTCQANHPNDNVHHYEMWEYYKGAYVKMGDIPAPVPGYAWPETLIEWSMDIPRERLFSAIYRMVAVDYRGCRSSEDPPEEYDPKNIHDEQWACWEQQKCIDDILKPKKPIIRLEE